MLPSNAVSHKRVEHSLERSQRRRADASAARRERRRRRIQLPGTGLSLLLAGALVAGTGAQVAVGHVTEQREVAAYAALGMVKNGSSGTSVAAVQRALGLPADGVFGPSTRRAVMAFQRRNGLVVDGIVGPRTRAALGVGSAPPATPRKRTPSGRVTATPTGGALAPPDEAPGTGTPQTESTPAPGSGTPRTKTAPPATGNVPAALRRIAQCESGGNPGAIGGGGTYRGKYQFTRETWRNLGGKGDPARAPEAEQDRLAMKLYSQAGSAPWANCAR